MKLLLCISALKDIESALRTIEATPLAAGPLPYIHAYKILQHEVDIVETGVGLYQTTYKLTKALSLKKYHLALKIGFGNAYKPEIEIGSALNVINEKPGDFGMMVNGVWKDHYDFELINREDAPHVRGGLINMSNAYMNVFAPFKKSVSLTVNHYGDASSFEIRHDKYKADCETGDGLGFVYPCLFEKQPFYQLCMIERNLATGEHDFERAKAIMNETLVELIRKL